MEKLGLPTVIRLIERLKNAAGGPEGIKMCQDAATAIETLRADLARVTAERDLVIEYVRGQCRYCKRNLVCISRKSPHVNCWEYCGIKEDRP